MSDSSKQRMIIYPLAAGGIVTRVLRAGETGPNILLLHGFTSRADRWRQSVVDFAAQGYRVFAPDLPGHGFATKSETFDHSVRGYRDFILDLLDRLGLDRVTLVGTSLGGHILAKVAAHSPERATHLVMIGSMGLQALGSDRVKAIRAGLADMSPAAIRSRLLSVFTDPSHVSDDLVTEDVLVNTSPGAAESLAKFGAYLASDYNEDLVLDDLAALDGKVPLLMIWGEDDKSMPVEIARMARKRLPHSKLATLGHVSHTPYIENPEAFQEIIREFLTGRAGDKPLPGVTYT
jgi:pimeloyl-ACP methyl ester carboxylesterase